MPTISLNIVRIVELLLKAGANPNVWDVNDQTPMHIIFECDQGARTKRSMDVLKLLLKYGADPSIRNSKGRTFYNYVRLPYSFRIILYLYLLVS